MDNEISTRDFKIQVDKSYREDVLFWMMKNRRRKSGESNRGMKAADAVHVMSIIHGIEQHEISSDLGSNLALLMIVEDIFYRARHLPESPDLLCDAVIKTMVSRTPEIIQAVGTIHPFMEIIGDVAFTMTEADTDVWRSEEFKALIIRDLLFYNTWMNQGQAESLYSRFLDTAILCGFLIATKAGVQFTSRVLRNYLASKKFSPRTPCMMKNRRFARKWEDSIIFALWGLPAVDIENSIKFALIHDDPDHYRPWALAAEGCLIPYTLRSLARKVLDGLRRFEYVTNEDKTTQNRIASLISKLSEKV